MCGRIFIHDTSILAADGTVREPDDGYHMRALCVSRPGDVVVLDSTLRAEAVWLMAHYTRIGMPVARDIVLGLTHGAANLFEAYRLDPFIFDDRSHAVQPNTRWHRIVAETNDKNRCLRLAKRLGIPIPDTVFFDDVSEVGDLEQYRYPLYCKLAVSFAGLGVWFCKDAAELESRLREIGPGLAFQLQQPEEGTFLNVSYFCPGDGTVRRVLCTEQILEGPCHVGNGPSKLQPWGVTDPFARYMAAQGMVGYFAFDVVVLPDGRCKLVECNPRWNGGCYPTEAGLRLGQTNWEARGYKTTRTLGQLDFDGLEYNPGTRSGVVVLNLGQLAAFHKVSLMLAGTPEQRAALVRRLPTVLD